MKRRLIVIFTLLICSTAYVLAQKSGAKNNRPNVIYIYLDDMGYGELGSYGQQKIKTPNLDKLASEGMRFTRHYSSAPVCAPARACLMTGKHTGHSYIRGNYELGGFEDSTEGGQMPLPENTPTIAKLMQGAGYTTGAIGKWGLGMHDNTGNPNEQGFDYFYGYYCQKQAHNFYPTHLWENGKWDSLRNPYIYVHQKLPEGTTADSAFDKFIGTDYAITKMAQKTKAFISKNKDKPFFLYLPYTGPHVSLQAPKEEVAKYLGQFPEVPYLGYKGGYAPNKNPLATYAAMITYIDTQVGEIFALLKDLQLDQNTLVLFSSDNGATFDVGGVQTGFFNSVAGFRGRKMDLYEGGIRVPFIAHWPSKIKAGTISDVPSVQYDMMATLAQLTNQKTPATDGISLLPTLLGSPQTQAKRGFMYFEYPEKTGQVAVMIGDWKGVKSDIKKNKQAPWEIYNLKTDPYETTNVAAQYPALAVQMEKILKDNHRHPHVSDWEFIDGKLPAKK